MPIVQSLDKLVFTTDIAHIGRQFVLGELIAHEHRIGRIILQMQYSQRRIHKMHSIAIIYHDSGKAISLKQAVRLPNVKNGRIFSSTFAEPWRELLGASQFLADFSRSEKMMVAVGFIPCHCTHLSLW
jgi:hypothetical protein